MPKAVDRHTHYMLKRRVKANEYNRQVFSVLQDIKQSPVQPVVPPSPGSLSITRQALTKSRPPAAAATVPLLYKHCTAHFIYPSGPGRRPRHKHTERPAQLPSTESLHNKQDSGSNEQNSNSKKHQTMIGRGQTPGFHLCLRFIVKSFLPPSATFTANRDFCCCVNAPSSAKI